MIAPDDLSRLAEWLRDYDCGDDIAHAQFDAAADALSSQSLSLSEAREEIERLKGLVAGIRECPREPWQDIATAPKDGTFVDLWHSEFGRHADCYWGFPEHCCGESGRYCDSEWHRLEAGWVDGTLNESLDASDFTHWHARPSAPGSALENGPAALADANPNPPLSDLSSLRKGAEVAIDVLEQCEAYFDNRADADCEGDPAEFVPNKEMILLSAVREAIAALVSGSREGR